MFLKITPKIVYFYQFVCIYGLKKLILFDFFKSMPMIEDKDITSKEKIELIDTTKWLISQYSVAVPMSDMLSMLKLLKNSYADTLGEVRRHGQHVVLRNLSTAKLLTEKIAIDRNMCMAILLRDLCHRGVLSIAQVEKQYGSDVAYLLTRLIKVAQLYSKQLVVKDENFQKLLLTFAEDIRVIIIMIVDRLDMMRTINHHPDEAFVREISLEARYLYAPLSHRLGLYTIKSELEDLSLKYLNRRVYSQIAKKLNETKVARNRYVENFIVKIREALEKVNLKFEIKGRTKTINSIWNKMKKKDVDLNGMYDLFAIRIIIDTAPENEKRDCWVAYSIITDIFTANPSRMRDWVTIPKSNGYESLHTTVKGPEDKWVEVQIRTKRMDEIAERGLAAHWKYKGVKSEADLDRWMNSAREILEAGSAGHMELIRSMNMNIYEKEVFVFTPKGDLYRLPNGASVLDFAFAIHTKVGHTCVGARVDGKNQKLNYKLKNGDTIEVLTSSTQMPRLDWLNYVVTSKARAKIKVAVNESRARQADMGRELLYRRLKNRKLPIDDGKITKLLKPFGFKTLTDFFLAIKEEKLDVADVVERYEQPEDKHGDTQHEQNQSTAQNFVLHQVQADAPVADNVLIIGNDVKGINYKLANCCKPIYGDKIVGFIASDGAVKIHRSNCGNALHLKQKYPYRIINSQWSGKLGAQFAAGLRVVGKDSIGIVSNITSVINKMGSSTLRSISINSHDGSFEGQLVIGISSLNELDELIAKISALKGVRQVSRL